MRAPVCAEGGKHRLKQTAIWHRDLQDFPRGRRALATALRHLIDKQAVKVAPVLYSHGQGRRGSCGSGQIQAFPERDRGDDPAPQSLRLRQPVSAIWAGGNGLRDKGILHPANGNGEDLPGDGEGGQLLGWAHAASSSRTSRRWRRIREPTVEDLIEVVRRIDDLGGFALENRRANRTGLHRRQFKRCRAVDDIDDARSTRMAALSRPRQNTMAGRLSGVFMCGFEPSSISGINPPRY